MTRERCCAWLKGHSGSDRRARRCKLQAGHTGPHYNGKALTWCDEAQGAVSHEEAKR